MSELWTLTVEDFGLDSGGRLSPAQLRYRVVGTLSPKRDNAVLLFSYFTGTDRSYDRWIGPGRALDPARNCIVIFNHLGGGVSSSPSNTAGTFPDISVADNARAAMLVLNSLSVECVQLAAGWSVGGMQSLEFAAKYTDSVSSVFALCSAARCSEINQVFLDAVDEVLDIDPRFAENDPGRPPTTSLNAFGKVYAGWAYSEEFFSDNLYRDFGYRDVEHVLDSWGRDHEVLDAHDLRCSLRMWRSADIGHDRGGLEAGLARVTAKTVLMPSTTDRYFTIAENERELGALQRGELRPLVSPLGHIAGRPGIRDREQHLVDDCLRHLLTGPT